MEHRPVQAALIIIGNELLNGTTTDTNSTFLAGFLRSRAVSVRSLICVPDVAAEISAALRGAIGSADIVFTSGGLGPTSDDITRYSIAEVCSQRIVLNELSLSRMKEKYRVRGVPENNISFRQVEFPEGAEVIENNFGTADSFLTVGKGSHGPVPIVALPGVPREFHGIVNTTLDAVLQKHLPNRLVPQRRCLRVFGLPESLIGQKVESLGLPPEIEVSYRAIQNEVVVSLLTPDATLALDAAYEGVINILGSDFVVSRDESVGVVESVSRLLEASSATVSFAESCTGGRIADLFVARPGASALTPGGVVAYAAETKARFLDVPEQVLQEAGVVSESCARAMAEGARKKFRTTFALSSTGVAGPAGGTDTAPVGTVYLALATEKETLVTHALIRREREGFRHFVALMALNSLRQYLLR